MPTVETPKPSAALRLPAVAPAAPAASLTVDGPR